MYTANFPEKQALGLHKLTGDNSGEVFTNEREVKVTDPETQEERTEYQYDIYQVPDARDPHKVKDSVISEIHPNGDETKILRKTLAKVLKATLQYDSAEYAEFKAYNEFAESIGV
jgi:hypothetical protein